MWCGSGGRNLLDSVWQSAGERRGIAPQPNRPKAGLALEIGAIATELKESSFFFGETNKVRL